MKKYAGALFAFFLVLWVIGDYFTWTDARRVEAERNHLQAEVRQLRAEHDRDHDALTRRLASERAHFEQERRIWRTNLGAVLIDMEHYEEDLERCRHVR